MPEQTDIPGDTDIAASLASVTKHYGKTAALTDVDLEFRAGEAVALLGPNGAGKTTTVGLLLGTLRPMRGEVRVFDDDPVRGSGRQRVGAMLQRPNSARRAAG